MGCAGSLQTADADLDLVMDQRLPKQGSREKASCAANKELHMAKDDALHSASGADLPASAEPKVPFHQQQLITRGLGKGAFACVYAAHRFSSRDSIKDFTVVAAKVTDLRSTRKGQTSTLDPRLCRCAEKEAQILSMLCNERRCVACIDHYIEGCFAYLVMEKCDTTLHQALESCPAVTESTLARFLKGMLQGLNGIHSVGIVHRDIKPDNFLYCGGLEDGTVKLCDFGLADTVHARRPDLKGVFGTAPFMSPEMLEGKGYNEQTDVWSFSVIAYVLLLGHFPYSPTEKTSKAMKEAILSGAPSPSFQMKPGVLKGGQVSEGALKFLRTLLVRDPQLRSFPDTALNDPWLQGPMPMVADNLIDLKPLIRAASKVGAFTPPAVMASTGELDLELAVLQAKYHGRSSRLGKHSDACQCVGAKG